MVLTHSRKEEVYMFETNDRKCMLSLWTFTHRTFSEQPVMKFSSSLSSLSRTDSSGLLWRTHYIYLSESSTGEVYCSNGRVATTRSNKTMTLRHRSWKTIPRPFTFFWWFEDMRIWVTYSFLNKKGGCYKAYWMSTISCYLQNIVFIIA